MSLKRKLIATLCAAVLMFSMVFVGCTPAPSTTTEEDTAASTQMKLVKEGTLTVGSDCDYPPFIELKDGQPAGFEYELLDAIAADMGLTLEFLEPQNFDTLPTSVAGGVKMDLACSSITINDERKEMIDFSDAYFDSNQACVVRGDSTYTSSKDLANMTVGAQAGTTGMDWANEHISGITLIPYNTASDGLTALTAGGIEAMFFDAPSAEYQIANNFQDLKMIEVIPTGEQYGFAISKENPALKEAVNQSLQNIIDNGTYEQIFKKYFPNLDPSIK